MKRRSDMQAGQAYGFALLCVVGLTAMVGFGGLGEAATLNIAGTSSSDSEAANLSDHDSSEHWDGQRGGQGASHTSSNTPGLGSKSEAGALSTVRRVLGMADRVKGARYFEDASGVRVRLQVPDGPVPEGGHKTVMFFPGWLADETLYHNLPRMLREEGFATAVMSVPNRFEPSIATRVGHAETAMELVRTHARRGELDLDNFVLMGHSMGGATALALSPTRTDVAATVSLAPGWMPTSQAFMNAAAARKHGPQLVIGAKYDRVVPMKPFARNIADACRSSGVCKFVEGRHMSHNNFADTPKFMMWAPRPDSPLRLAAADTSSVSPRVMSAYRQQRATVRIAIPWLRQQFETLGLEMPRLK